MDGFRSVMRACFAAVLGFVVAAIVAVNVVIASGVDRGYEASLGEVFEENPVAGVITVAVLVAGPVVGVWTAKRIAQGR